MKKLYLIYLFVLTYCLSGCSIIFPLPKIVIGVSCSTELKNQIILNNWLKSYSENIDIIYLNTMSLDSAFIMLDLIDGLIINDGPDIDKSFVENFKLNKFSKFDNIRYELEVILLRRAVKLEMPILAIGRGGLIVNLVNGGEINFDLANTVREPNTSHKLPEDELIHKINIKASSMLFEMIGLNEGYVNSSHNQSIKTLGKNFIANAISDDKIIEAFSYKSYSEKPFLFCIQWNPEKLLTNNPFSYKILNSFINHSKAYKKLNIPNI